MTLSFGKKHCYPLTITEAEAKADGFSNLTEMRQWLTKTYGYTQIILGDMNKLTIRWSKEKP